MDPEFIENILSLAVGAVESSSINDEITEVFGDSAPKTLKCTDNLDATSTNNKTSRISSPKIVSDMFTGSMSATTSRITSSIKSRTASASFDTLPVRTTKVGAIPNYIKQRKHEINSENSKTPSRSSSRPSTASEIIPEKKLKLGAIPSYLKKDHVPNLSGEFKMKLEKYETLKNNLAHIKQKLKVAFMDCKKISENSGGKITFEDSLKEDALSTSQDSRPISHPVAAIARSQVEDIKQEYLKSAQKFLEEFNSQIHEGGDQAGNTIFERFEESLQKINDQHVLTDKPEKSLQDAVQDPNQLQEQEMYFAQIISDKEEVLLAHKHEAAQKMNVLNNRVKELNKNYTDQTKHVHDLKKTIENHENTIKSLETTIKENLHHKKNLDGKLNKLTAENQSRLTSESDKTNQLLKEKKELLQMNQGLTEDSKSKVAKLEAEIYQLRKSLYEQENQLDRRNLSKTDLLEQKQKLQLIYEDKEREVEKFKHEIAKLSEEKSKFTIEMQLLKENMENNQEDQMRLKSENKTLAAELNQAKYLQTKTIDTQDHNSQIEQLKRDILNMQVVERRVRHESKILESKLVSEKRENYTNLNLMQLRGELIKTLQEKDESNKTRIILLLKNQEDCMDDIKKLSMLNCAKDEEYKNMLDTLKSTELEKEALIHECESYKGDLHLFSDKMRRKSLKAQQEYY